MDADSPWIIQEPPHSPDHALIVTTLTPFPELVEVNCIVCGNLFLPVDDRNEESESICVCGACKVTFLEDLENSTGLNHRRRPRRRRRSRYSRSSDSIEDLFSQQFSQLINLVRQSEDNVPIPASEHELQHDGDSAYTNVPYSSSQTTPNRSGRWRLYSDYESDGFGGPFDSSLFGESDSNFSFGGYGAFPGDSDAVSFSAYGGGSDVSVDDQSYTDQEVTVQADIDGSNLHSDTDIDPMRAGEGMNAWNTWNSDDQEEEGDWMEEADIEENSEPVGWGHQYSGPDGNPNHVNWLMETNSPGFDSRTHWRIRENERAYIPNNFSRLESVLTNYVGNSANYLDARRFEELLEQLVETDNTRRGAPPASASFVGSLPRFLICEEHEKHGGILCAVCKDPLTINTEVNQLPCSHLYHPSCILPWLSTRNSCPVCRYELPTDDKDYEDGKQAVRNRSEIHGHQEANLPVDDSSSDSENEFEVDESQGRAGEIDHNGTNEDSDVSAVGEGPRGGWLFLAAAPIVSIVGIVLVLWFRNPLAEGSMRCRYRRQVRQTVQTSSETFAGRENRRRWWSFF